MEKFDYLIEAVNSDEFIENAMNNYCNFLYLNKDNNLERTAQNMEKFISYLKAQYIKEFFETDDEEIQEAIIESAFMGKVYPNRIYWIFDNINISSAKVGQFMNLDGVKKIKELQQYLNNPMYKELSKKDEYIKKSIIENQKYNTIEEIENGKYIQHKGYTLDKEEIQTIKNAKLIPTINRTIHVLYDEYDEYRISYCEYEDIDDEILKKFAFHTNKNNPEFNIIFEDGTIVNYFYGDIRVMPYKLEDYLTYTKLHMIEEMEQSNDKEFQNDEFELLMTIGIVRTTIVLLLLLEVYTKKMINRSKEKLNDLKQLVKKYNL